MLDLLGQTHVLKFYDTLDGASKAEFLRQLNETDLSIISLAASRDKISAAHAKSDSRIEPLRALTLSEIKARRAEFEAAGLEALRAGKVAAVLLAGGQGTRLGSNRPKGTYNVGLTRDLYIFECLINNMLDTVRACGRFFPLYIMTSDKNDADTRAFFEEHDYFGYDRGMVKFFVQDMAPSVDFGGKLLLEAKDRLSLSPSGNGGWFNSLENAGYLDDLKAKGVEWISIFAVDNVLQRVNDPAFVGATLLSGVECGAKVIRKNSPDERIGVICLEDGHPSIIEYYEATDELKNLRAQDGELVYSFGVTLNYLFKVEALERMSHDPLPYHIVEKKVPYIDGEGNYINPEKVNGLKFERLAFDIIRRLDSCLPYEVEREFEFAPIKNASGVDSVESARELLKKNGVKL